MTVIPRSVAGVALAALLTTVSACAPDLGPAPKLSAPQNYAASRSLAAPVSPWPADAWWKAYNDPQLDGLIAEALRGAPDLREAQARVRQAEAAAIQAGAPLLPSVNANGSIKETKIQQSVLPAQVGGFLPQGWSDATQLGASLNWQLDFFGRNRAALAAATSQTVAARADEAAARLQIASGVAAAYAQLLQLYADRSCFLSCRSPSFTFI